MQIELQEHVGKVKIYFTLRTTNVEPPDGRTPPVMQRASYVIPSPSKVQTKMQWIDSQVVEMQQGSERQCWKIFTGSIPFSKPVQTIYMRRCAFQELAKGTDHTVQLSNIVHNALKAGIPTP